MRASRRGFVQTFAALCGLAMLATFNVNVAADNLDEELIRQASKVMKHLESKNYRNAGVLAFGLKSGDGKPSFDGGLLTNNLGARLENALVLALNPEGKQIGIIRDASSVASRALKGASYRTAEDRKRLFEIKYPLAWGTAEVEADVFLAGLVTISSDHRNTNVAIVSFDRQDPETHHKVIDFDVKTDRQILADSGKGFSTSKGRATFSRGPSEEDIFDAIIRDEKKEPKVGPQPGNSQLVTSVSDDFPIEVKVRYRDVVQTMRPDPDNPGAQNRVLDDPKEGEAVTFDVTNRTKEVVGMVLTVNGISTLFEETGQAGQMTKWVLDPGKLYRIKGFHQKDRSKYVTIEGLPEKLSEERFEDLGGAAKGGLIHVFVFRKVSEQVAAAPSFSRSMRRIPTPVLSDVPPQTPAELQKLIAHSANAKGGRGLMAWGPDEKEEKITEQSLGATSLTDTMVIRYYKPKNRVGAPTSAK